MAQHSTITIKITRAHVKAAGHFLTHDRIGQWGYINDFKYTRGKKSVKSVLIGEYALDADDDDPNALVKITPQDLVLAAVKALKRLDRYFADSDLYANIAEFVFSPETCVHDRETGDILIQFAMFSEHKYV